MRVIGLLAVLASCSAGCAKSSRPLDPPEHIHLSWQGAPTHRTITVVWRAKGKRAAIRYGLGAKLSSTAEAQSVPYADSYLHSVTLAGLTPARHYHYRVGSEHAWSEMLTFRTAPAPDAREPIIFAATGDSRSNSAVRSRVARALAREKPLFVLHTGDLVSAGERQSNWDSFFSTMQPLLARSAFMPAVGNHEHNAPQYFRQFVLPEHRPRSASHAAEAYYSFDVGYLHLVTLSTEPAGKIDGPQYRWLAADLARAKANPRIRWIIVQAHRPPYSSGPHGDNQPSQQWVPLFEAHGVDLTFWGHDHLYERTKPLRGHKPTSKGGITYIVTGGGGATLYKGKGNQRTAVIRSAFHFVLVRATPNELVIRAKDPAGRVFDRFVLKKK